MPILVLGFGILAICIKKTFLVFATCKFLYNLAFIGAYLCLRALSWELGAFPNEFLYPLYYQLNLK